MESQYTASGQVSQLKWVRSDKGLIAGICQGLGERMAIDPVILRVVWVLSICIFGLGLGFYLILWMTLPTESKAADSNKGQILGVCARLAERQPLEAEVARAFRPWVALAPSSDGAGLPMFEGRAATGAAVAYVCEEMVCQLPVSTVEALRIQLEA